MSDENAPYIQAFRVFEKERQELFAAEVDALPFDVSELRRAMSPLVREDIRFVPVIACAFADSELEQMFKQFLPDNIPGGKSSMLGRFDPYTALYGAGCPKAYSTVSAAATLYTQLVFDRE